MIYQREFNLSPVEFIKFQLYNAINLPNPILNESDITVLAYIHVYGAEAKKKIVEHRIFTNINSFSNYVTRLRSMGYIDSTEEGRRKLLRLNPDIVLVKESYILISNINLDKTSTKVVHPYFKEEK